MKLSACFFNFFLGTLGAIGSQAIAQNLAAGNYVYEGGNGTLNIRTDKSFSISTVGGNGHLCDVDGTLLENHGKASESKCVLTFNPVGTNVQVDTNGDGSCREFCGARAGFEGLYIKPSLACTAIAQTRGKFKRQYDQRDYVSAIQTLAPILEQCKQVLNRFEEGWIRNDLALAQLKNGDKAACLNTLSPLVEIANMTEADIRDIPEPTYVSNYLSIAKAVRVNLRLCKTPDR